MKKKFIIDKDNENNKDVARLAVRFIKALCFEQSWEVIIKPYRKSLTEEQSGFFHVLCKYLADETGYRPKEIKIMVKQYVYGTKYKTVGGKRFVITESSVTDEDGESRSAKEYSELIEGIYELAAQAEVVLPPPKYTGRN